jgi:hypothetical protein
LDVNQAIGKTKEALTRLTNHPFDNLVGVSEDDGGWRITLELLERKAIPDTSDILGVYEAKVDADGKVKSFSRVSLRTRGDTEKDIEKKM